MSPKRENLVGQRFGRNVAVHELPCTYSTTTSSMMVVQDACDFQTFYVLPKNELKRNKWPNGSYYHDRNHYQGYSLIQIPFRIADAFLHGRTSQTPIVEFKTSGPFFEAKGPEESRIYFILRPSPSRKTSLSRYVRTIKEEIKDGRCLSQIMIGGQKLMELHCDMCFSHVREDVLALIGLEKYDYIGITGSTSGFNMDLLYPSFRRIIESGLSTVSTGKSTVSKRLIEALVKGISRVDNKGPDLLEKMIENLGSKIGEPFCSKYLPSRLRIYCPPITHRLSTETKLELKSFERTNGRKARILWVDESLCSNLTVRSVYHAAQEYASHQDFLILYKELNEKSDTQSKSN